MTATLAGARDEINQMFVDAWNANTTAVAGYIPEVRFAGTERGTLPAATVAWARLAIQHTMSEQVSVGAIGNRRFERRGLVTAQIFTPLSEGKGLSLAEGLATIARNAYEGKTSPGAIWFINVSVKEVGVDEPWFQTNVSATFCYDEIK